MEAFGFFAGVGGDDRRCLASTDPVMLRGLLRRPGLPETVRLALRLESGLNDIVLLPIILVAMATLSHSNVFGLESRALGLSYFFSGPELA